MLDSSKIFNLLIIVPILCEQIKMFDSIIDINKIVDGQLIQYVDFHNSYNNLHALNV